MVHRIRKTIGKLRAPLPPGQGPVECTTVCRPHPIRLNRPNALDVPDTGSHNRPYQGQFQIA
jgi:hypothetical protein